jgi:hypothetical protein
MLENALAVDARNYQQLRQIVQRYALVLSDS